MQVNSMLLVLAGFGICCIIVVWISKVLESIQVPKTEEKSKEQNKKSMVQKREGTYSFHRVNDVEGILTVNGKKMKTYNIGELCLDDQITLRFFEDYNTDIRITDIYFHGKSIYAFAPEGDWRKKADYAISALKQFVNHGKCTASLASEVEEIILEVDSLNRHIESGRLVRTDDEGFAWIF